MYFKPHHKRSQICKLRYTAMEIHQFRRDAEAAGMQLATYMRELTLLARHLGAADLIRRMEQLESTDLIEVQHKSA